MALDIAFGDLLTLDGDEYPIKGVERWNLAAGMGMLALMTETAATKRAPAMSGGKRGAAVTHLTALQCTPLLPLTGEKEPRPLPHNVQSFECFIDDTDGAAVVRVIVDDVSQAA